MFLLRRRAAPNREQAWRSHADRLGLEAVEDGAELLNDLLGLGPDASVGPVYSAPGSDPARVLVFDYLDTSLPPGGRESRETTACLLVAPERIAAAPLRAYPRLHEVMATIRAGASGGQLVSVQDEEFERVATVVAREPAAATATLTPAVRAVLARCLARPGASATVSVSESSLLLGVRGEGRALEALEFLISDLLSLYAALTARLG